ncbi:uncharacterized protein F13E9.13, mitochondrial-like isoform X2 [Hyla sarda]|uniref:uncharacterized protein F13E9.13, mitochondrial-like isoform X2 n=1 Tax=Hyla sarda TaxID=327740 RepID=UPI0024C41B76|nr:uncharacterized protein F13E9.13, mitochondrial-like isoform X2 [Hyla sarda]
MLENSCRSLLAFHSRLTVDFRGEKAMTFLQLFGRMKSVVIGMVHLKALPGTPRGTLPVAQILEDACKEAEIYRKAGIDGLMVENMNDIPYTLHVGPEVTASMATVCAAVKQICPRLPLGVQVLACANQQALAVALAAGADFVRAESFVFSHVADEGLVNACAGELLRYRKAIGADHIQIFADIKKKHSSHAMTSDISISEMGKAAEFFLADGVILTGAATGQEADPRELKEVQRSVRIPVLIGSGVTLDNVEKYIDANALIIGSYFKHQGDWRNCVDYDKVMTFMDKINKLRD